MEPVVVIVSNDLSKLSIFRNIVQPIGHLIERTDIVSAEQLLKNSSVQVVVLDSHLGEPFTSIKKLRTAIGSADTPLLLITSELKKSFTEQALAAGATHFINEPLDRDEIEGRIKLALAGSHRSQQISRFVQKATPPPSRQSDISSRELFTQHAVEAVAAARKNHPTVSLLMIELSPPATTEQLTQLASLLEKSVRQNDQLIPQGRGKYLLILPKASQRAAELIAETLRHELPTLSIGVATATHADNGDLLKKVSQSFEKAKYETH